MTTQQAIDALHALPRMGGAPTLTRMQNLLAHLGNPEAELPCVHIAGTNGKGSLAAMVSSILTKAGYKTGLTVSPFVTDFRERFQINGEMIPPRTLTTLARKVLNAVEEIKTEGGECPVEFEAVTALALLWFAREKCDLVVLETGLGGRCDATNAVPRTLVAAITKIGLDHTEILGDTVAKIAAEKAGILKPGCTLVCYPDQPKDALEVITAAAAQAGVRLVVPDKEDLNLEQAKPLKNLIDYGGYQVRLRMPGRHQAYHAAMAVEVALALWRDFGYEISDEAILDGLAAASMPARMEVLRRHPLLLLDGGHNPDGVSALAAELKQAGYEENLVGVMGVMADKNYESMLTTLTPCFAKLYTVTPDSPRALSAEELQYAAKFHLDAEAAPSVKEGIRRALDYCEEQHLPGVVVCGSLYLAAQARPYLLKEAER